MVWDEDNVSLPTVMHQALLAVVDQLEALGQQINKLDRIIAAQHKSSDVSQRLASIPGIGVIGATAIAATITDPNVFKSGRDLAAWIGLVPRQHSTGGKNKLGGISEQGDRYLRRLLVVGATAVVRHAQSSTKARDVVLRQPPLAATRLVVSVPTRRSPPVCS
jgi:transposase